MTVLQLDRVEAPSCCKTDEVTLNRTLNSYQLWEYCSVLSYATLPQCEKSYDINSEDQFIAAL